MAVPVNGRALVAVKRARELYEHLVGAPFIVDWKKDTANVKRCIDSMGGGEKAEREFLARWVLALVDDDERVQACTLSQVANTWKMNRLGMALSKAWRKAKRPSEMGALPMVRRTTTRDEYIGLLIDSDPQEDEWAER